MSRKNTKIDYHNLAKSRGFRWASRILPKNVDTKTWWKCLKCGYRWKARYHDIYSGNGCPFCAGLVKKTKTDYHNLANSSGFVWLGPFPKNTKIKTWWECKKGHRWQSRYNDIQTGYGCPRCKEMINGVKISKQQAEINKLLCGSLNYPEGKYRIDVAIVRKSQKIVVEYDCWYWHGGREKEDAKRDKYLINKGWKVIHIKSGEMLPTRKQLKQAINQILNNKNIVNIFLDDWKTNIRR